MCAVMSNEKRLSSQQAGCLVSQDGNRHTKADTQALMENVQACCQASPALPLQICPVAGMRSFNMFLCVPCQYWGTLRTCMHDPHSHTTNGSGSSC